MSAFGILIENLFQEAKSITFVVSFRHLKSFKNAREMLTGWRLLLIPCALVSVVLKSMRVYKND